MATTYMVDETTLAHKTVKGKGPPGPKAAAAWGVAEASPAAHLAAPLSSLS